MPVLQRAYLGGTEVQAQRVRISLLGSVACCVIFALSLLNYLRLITSFEQMLVTHFPAGHSRTGVSTSRGGTRHTPRSRVSASREGRGCTPRSCFSSCREGRGCTTRSCFSPCREGRGCTSRSGISSCRGGTGCTERSCFSACRGGRGCTPRSCVSAYRGSSQCTPRSRVSACREGRGCTPRTCFSACRVRIASVPSHVRFSQKLPHAATSSFATPRPLRRPLVNFVSDTLELFLTAS